MIIWAVDPFARSPELQRSAAFAIRSAQESFRRPPKVQPVYISASNPHPTPQAVLPFHRDRLARDVSVRLKGIVNRIPIRHLLPVQVVASPALSIKGLTDALLSYAHEQDGDLIVLSSRTKTGPSRWFLGSFAETLLLRTSIPVMVVNPRWKNRGASFRRVLFATDFSEASWLAFLDALPLIERWGAKLEIFHKVKYEVLAIARHARSPSPKGFHAQMLERYLESLRAKAEAWQLQARHYGISASIRLDDSMVGTLAGRIVKAAERSADLIALAAESSAAQTRILGSVSRSVMRASSCPVWVFRSPARKASAKRRKKAA